MDKREIIWTEDARVQLREIMTYFLLRNKNGAYSWKLYLNFRKSLEAAAKEPEIGIKTRLDKIRGLIVGNYILFYEVLKNRIMVLQVWDSRRDPDKLKIRTR